MTSTVFTGTSYDELPYPEFAFPLTHPDRLAVLARIHGIAPAPVAGCRVLEVGCASGSNLIPLAYSLPGSSFVGIDLSPRQIASGQHWIAELGLHNVALHACDLCELDTIAGPFDYIIAHGVYSWVPADVRDGLLALCRRHLAPRGVAYVSYNTYPGWRPLQALRESLIFLTRGATTTGERIAHTRAILAELAAAGPSLSPPYDTVARGNSRFVQSLAEQLGPAADSYLSHELLETDNYQCSFTTFVEHARTHGLQFVTEADYGATCTHQLEPAARQLLAGCASDLERREQLIDMLLGRTFRMSLLCHSELALSCDPGPAWLGEFAIAADLHPQDEGADPRAPGPLRFRGPNQLCLSLTHPLSKAALIALSHHWPHALTWAELVTAAVGQLESAEPSAAELDRLGRTLWSLFCMRSSPLALWTTPRPHPPRATERPRASAIARSQARRGTLVTTLVHTQVVLDPLLQGLLPYLDGQRTCAELGSLVATIAARYNQPPEPLDLALGRLSRLGLLE